MKWPDGSRSHVLDPVGPWPKGIYICERCRRVIIIPHYDRYEKWPIQFVIIKDKNKGCIR